MTLKEDLPTGAVVHFEVQLASAVTFEGQGTIVRRELHGREFGYAIAAKNGRIHTGRGGANDCAAA